MSILKISRLEGLIEGVFAIAMTILVLDLKINSGIESANISQFLLSNVAYNLFVYIGSFIILGTLWVAINFQQGLLAQLNRPYLWANIFYLMTICVVPFSASLVASYPNSQASISFFAINLLCTSLGQLLTTETAHHYNLYKWFYDRQIRIAITKRVFLAPIFYILSLLVAFWNTHLAFIILVLPILIYIKPGSIDKYSNVDDTQDSE